MGEFHTLPPRFASHGVVPGARAMQAAPRDLVSVHVAKPTAQFVFASPSFDNVVGYAPEALVGNSIFDFMHSDDSIVFGPR